MKWFEFGVASAFFACMAYGFLWDFRRFWARHHSDVADRVAAYTADEALVPAWARDLFEAIDGLPETVGTEA